MSTTFCFSLPGIHCVNCVKPIESALSECTSIHIENFAVELIEKKLTVIVADDTRSTQEIRRLLQRVLGDVGVDYVDIDSPNTLCQRSMQAEDNASLAILPSAKQSSFSLKKFFRSHWFLGFIGTASGIALLVLSLVSGALPFIASLSIAVLSVPLTLVLGAGSYKDAAIKLFKTRALTMDLLFAISTLTAITVSVAAFFFPWLPMMFEAGLLIFGFRHIGFGIEESIKQAMGLGVTFKDRLPLAVDVVLDKSLEKRRLQEIKPEDILFIKPGDIIPVDGLCDMDEGTISDTIVTGSMLPRPITQGERLLAGMSVPEGSRSMRMRVTAAAKDSYLAQLDATIARANYEKAPLETATNKILQYFIPIVILFAILSAIIVGSFSPLSLAIQCAVAVLASACPCTLGFITPLAVKIGMNKAAAHGVRFKSAKTLQEAEQIDSVVFDLNGTLTEGVPAVRTYGVAGDATISAHEMLAYFSILENDSLHPMAKAICTFIKEQDITPPLGLQMTNLDQTSHHSGITADINHEQYTLGNQTMMDDTGIDTQQIQDSLHVDTGDTVIYLARVGKVIGYMVLADRLRSNARHAVDSLKSMGKQVYLCTGADEATARRYAAMLGISPANTRAGCVGAAVQGADRDKKAYIEELKQQGHRVAFVGDGPNDAVAIAASHFGIAVESFGGDEMTQQEAGAVIQGGSLLPVVSAFAVAKQTVTNIKQNLLMSLGYNTVTMLVAGGLLLAIGFTLNPGIGVALMILQTSLILYNAYRFQQQKLEHLQQTTSVQGYPTSSYRRLKASMPAPSMGQERGQALSDALMDYHDTSLLCQPRQTEVGKAFDDNGLLNMCPSWPA